MEFLFTKLDYEKVTENEKNYQKIGCISMPSTTASAYKRWIYFLDS